MFLNNSLSIRYEEAEEDCTRAILCDSSYSKAFARRGTARAALGKLKEAMQGRIVWACLMLSLSLSNSLKEAAPIQQ